MRASLRFALVAAATIHAIPSDIKETVVVGNGGVQLQDFVAKLQEAGTVADIQSAMNMVIKTMMQDADGVLKSMEDDLNTAFSAEGTQKIYGTVDKLRTSALDWVARWYTEHEQDKNILRSQYMATKLVGLLAERLNSYVDKVITKANSTSKQVLISPQQLARLQEEGSEFARNGDVAEAYVQLLVKSFKDAIRIEDTASDNATMLS